MTCAQLDDTVASAQCHGVSAIEFHINLTTKADRIIDRRSAMHGRGCVREGFPEARQTLLDLRLEATRVPCWRRGLAFGRETSYEKARATRRGEEGQHDRLRLDSVNELYVPIGRTPQQEKFSAWISSDRSPWYFRVASYVRFSMPVC
ncbi:Uncharacterised protein [Mycobacteroides abscessus subsp. bolletii]|nr:Uncharacterised protein [Mycobacteroides abscessus subsp. bolletii]